MVGGMMVTRIGVVVGLVLAAFLAVVAGVLWDMHRYQKAVGDFDYGHGGVVKPAQKGTMS